MPNPWTRRFEKAARRWQRELGLTDWCVVYRTEKSHDENLADVYRDCPSRNAIVTVYGDAKASAAETPERTALHEMLHVLLADLLRCAAQRGAEHVDTNVEEHRLIQRLLNVIPER